MGLIASLALAILAFTSTSAQSADPDMRWKEYEAAWTSAGGLEYKAAVHRLVGEYVMGMDTNCQLPNFDVGEAVSVYRVSQPGAEPVRAELVRKQVGTMACIMVHADGEKRAESLM